MYKRSLLIVGFFSMLSAGLLLTCSKNNSTPTEPPAETPAVLTISPTSGVPGTLLQVTGISLDSIELAQYTAFIGDQQAPLRRSGDSALLVGIPLFYDSTSNWSRPPADPVDLTIYKNGKPAAKSIVPITVDSLPHANGTAERIRDLLDTLATNLGSVLASAPINYPWEQELRDSVIAMLRNIANGGDSSLTAIINGTSPLLNGTTPNMELADALLASTGALGYWEDLTNGISAASSQVRQAIAAGENRGILCRAGGPDMDLACKMQLYVILKNFEQEFLSQTAQEWDLIGGTLFSTLGYTALAAEGPLLVAEIIGAALSVAEFVLQNEVLSLLPSHIAAFDVFLASDSIDVNQHTTSQVKIMALNSPETVTLNELVDVLTAGLSFALPGNLKETVKLFLHDIARFILDRLRAALLWLQASYPELNLDLSDPSLYTFPLIQFGPVLVEDPDLVRLVSYDENIARVDETMFEWEGISRGTVEIQAQTRGPGDRSKVVNEWFCLCQYTGGAFGEDAAMTQRYQLRVGRPGQLEVVIEGLPTDVDADVLVIYPDGTTFKHLTATETIPNLEPGNYEVQASERTASDSTVYVPEPATQTAVVHGDSTTTITIKYAPKFGNIYLVVNGLFAGEEGELPADIRIEGPNSFVRELTATTLIDSLLPGTYNVFAFEVDAPWIQTYVPNPDVAEVVVERGNTSPLTIVYTPKYGYLSVWVKNLPAGADGDVDVTGPDNYFHHLTTTEKIDSLLPGTYTIQAYPITDSSGTVIEPSPLTQTVDIVAGEEQAAPVDYSGGHELTVDISGLPAGALANISISGPDGYTASVTRDTTLKGLPNGGPFTIILSDVNFNGRWYMPKTTDTTIFMYSDNAVSFIYETRAIMSILLGGVHDPSKPDDTTGQFILRSEGSTSKQDTTITKVDYTPHLDELPRQLSLDTCGFEDGRLLLAGVTRYSVSAITSDATSNIDMAIDVNDSVALITFDGHIQAQPPSDPNAPGGSRAQMKILLDNLFRIEIYNPNDSSSTSVANARIQGRFEILNPVTTSGSIGKISWWTKNHLCNSNWSSPSYVFESYAGNYRFIDGADTATVLNDFAFPGSGVAGGESKEIDMGFELNLYEYAYPGNEAREITVHGEIEIDLLQF